MISRGITLLMILFIATPALAANTKSLPTPKASSDPLAKDERILSISAEDFMLTPKIPATWLRVARVFSLDSTKKAERSVAITNKMALQIQQSFDSTTAKQLIDRYNTEISKMPVNNQTVPVSHKSYNIILGDLATQLALIDKIAAVGGEDIQSNLKESQTRLLDRSIVLLKDPRLTEDTQPSRVYYFLNQYVRKEPTLTKKSYKKELLKQRIVANASGRDLQASINEKPSTASAVASTTASAATPSPKPSPSQSPSSSNKTSVKIESKSSSNSSGSSNTAIITITVDGNALKNSTRFSVNKGTLLQIKFRNNDSKSRKLVLSNGTTSDESSDGDEVSLKQIVVTDALTFSVPGENIKGSINVL